MQAYRRILSISLLLILGGEVVAQPEPGAAPAPGVSAAAPGTASANTNVQTIRRRFMRRTNEVLGSSNTTNPVPPAAAPANNAAAAPAAADPSPAVPAFPSFPEPPPRRSQAVPVAPGAAATVVPGSTNNLPLPAPGAAAIPANTAPDAVITAPADAQPAAQLPAPGAAQALPVPGAPGRTAIPMPGQAGATNLVAAEDQALLNTTPGGMPDPVNPALSADEVIPGGTLMLQGMPLDQFMDLYSLYSGRTILRPYALPAPQGLTLKAQTDLTRREVVQAMDGVLALNQITMIPVGDKFVKAVPSNLADKEGMEISTTPANQLPYAEQFLTRIVKLKTAKPSELAPTLQALSKTPTAVTPIDSNQTLILRDYASNLRRMLEVIEKVDVMPESDFTLEVIPIKYGKVQDIYSTMNALISGAGGGATTGGAAATTTAGAGAFGNRTGAFGGMGGMGGFGGSRFGGMGNTGYGGGSRYGGGSYGGNRYGGGGSYGSYYPQEMPTEVTPQQVVPGQPSPGAAQSDFNRRLNQIVNRAAGSNEEVRILEGAQIVPDERANQLLIFANKRDMSMITNIVSKVDVMLAQVLIEAVILEVKLGDTMRLGVSAAQNPKQWGQDFSGAGAINNGQLFSSLTNFPAGSPSGFSYFGTIGDDFDVAITALASDSEINIVSRPRIQTSHAIPGSFFIGETVPYVTGSYDYGFVGSGVQSRSIINEKDVGLDLGVTPFITPEGMVVMEISQTFQQRGQDVIIDGNPIPLVNTRAASAVLTVRNGDLIMLGGFISESKSKSKSGVPFLKDIPGLGVLFRSSNKSNDRTELIILMRATVLDTPEEAAFLAQRERLQLPGVRRAEREFEQSESKRLKKVEKESSRR